MMNIFEFARMVQHDIEIVYSSEGGVFTATMRGVFLSDQNYYAYAEEAHAEWAISSLCEQMSNATLRVRAEGSLIYTLKTSTMLLGDLWREPA
jgi:hypothetical protein